MNCNFVALARENMAIEAVVRDIELTANEPLAEGKFPLTYGVPWLLPCDQLFCLPSPECFVILIGFVIEMSANNEGVLLECIGRHECALFPLQSVDCLVILSHIWPPVAVPNTSEKKSLLRRATDKTGEHEFPHPGSRYRPALRTY